MYVEMYANVCKYLRLCIGRQLPYFLTEEFFLFKNYMHSQSIDTLVQCIKQNVVLFFYFYYGVRGEMFVRYQQFVYRLESNLKPYVYACYT